MDGVLPVAPWKDLLDTLIGVDVLALRLLFKLMLRLLFMDELHADASHALRCHLMAGPLVGASSFIRLLISVSNVKCDMLLVVLRVYTVKEMIIMNDYIGYKTTALKDGKMCHLKSFSKSSYLCTVA